MPLPPRSSMSLTQVPGLSREGRADVHRHVLAAGVLDAAQVQDLGAVGGHLQHVLVADLGDLPRARHDPRVGGEDAVHVGVDLAVLGAERCGQRDGRGVGRAASERRDVLGGLRDALEAGDDDDVALVERRLDAAGRDVDDAGVAVGAGGDHAGLRAGERPGGRAEVVDRHREQGRAHPLAGGEQHVELARTRARGDTCRARSISSSVVSPIAEMTTTTSLPCGLGGDDPSRHPLDALGVGDRRAAELLYHPHLVPPGASAASSRARERRLLCQRRGVAAHSGRRSADNLRWSGEPDLAGPAADSAGAELAAAAVRPAARPRHRAGSQWRDRRAEQPRAAAVRRRVGAQRRPWRAVAGDAGPRHLRSG